MPSVSYRRWRTTREYPPRFRVGDWVSFAYGPQRVWAQVIEDRGPIGIKGRRLYRVRLDPEQAESFSFEMPEVDLEAAVPDKAALARYLQDGGLVEVLRSNAGGGPNQPRAWLTFTSRGRLTHTDAAERGIVGGAPVPAYALHDGRVFTGKGREVIDFLTSFGLTRADAEEVLRAVGTAP